MRLFVGVIGSTEHVFHVFQVEIANTTGAPCSQQTQRPRRSPRMQCNLTRDSLSPMESGCGSANVRQLVSSPCCVDDKDNA